MKHGSLEVQEKRAAYGGRGLPDSIPIYIQSILDAGWKGNMKAFAEDIGLPYWSVYSVLVKSGLRPAKTLRALAKPLGISIDEMADILLIPDLVQRNQKIDELLAGKSRNQWAKEAGVSSGHISGVANNLEQTQIKNIWIISKALGLDLKRFSALFDRSKIAS